MNFKLSFFILFFILFNRIQCAEIKKGEIGDIERDSIIEYQIISRCAVLIQNERPYKYVSYVVRKGYSIEQAILGINKEIEEVQNSKISGFDNIFKAIQHTDDGTIIDLSKFKDQYQTHLVNLLNQTLQNLQKEKAFLEKLKANQSKNNYVLFLNKQLSQSIIRQWKKSDLDDDKTGLIEAVNLLNEHWGYDSFCDNCVIL